MIYLYINCQQHTMTYYKVLYKKDYYIGNNIDGFMKITNNKQFGQIWFVLDLSGSMIGDGVEGIRYWYNRDVNKIHKYIGFDNNSWMINNINDIKTDRGSTHPEKGFELLIKTHKKKQANIIFITDGEFSSCYNIDWQFFADAYDEINLTYVGFCGDNVNNMKNMENYIGKFTYTYIKTLKKFKETYDELVELVTYNPEYLVNIKGENKEEIKLDIDTVFKIKCTKLINTEVDIKKIKISLKHLSEFFSENTNRFIDINKAREYMISINIYSDNIKELLDVNNEKNKLSILSKLGRNGLSKTKITRNLEFSKYNHNILPTRIVKEDVIKNNNNVITEHGIIYTKKYFNNMCDEMKNNNISIEQNNENILKNNLKYKKRNKKFTSNSIESSHPYNLCINGKTYKIPVFTFDLGIGFLDKLPDVNNTFNFNHILFNGEVSIFEEKGDNIYDKVFKCLDNNKKDIVHNKYFVSVYNLSKSNGSDLPNVDAAILLWLYRNIKNDIIMINGEEYHNYTDEGNNKIRTINYTTVINYIKNNYDYNIPLGNNGFSYVSYQHSYRQLAEPDIKILNDCIKKNVGDPDIPVVNVKLTEPKYFDGPFNINSVIHFRKSISQLLASYVDINLMTQLHYHKKFKNIVLVFGPTSVYAQYTIAALIGYGLINNIIVCKFSKKKYIIINR